MAGSAPSVFSLIIDSVVSIIVVSLALHLRGKWTILGKARRKRLSAFFNWSFPEGINVPIVAFSIFACATMLSLLEFGAPSPYPLLLTIVLVFKPLFEEIAFRGLLLGGLLKKFGEKNNAIVLLFILMQSALFTLWHMRATAILPTFLFGSVLGLAFVFSKKNLLVPYIIHLGYNLYVLMFFFSKSA